MSRPIKIAIDGMSATSGGGISVARGLTRALANVRRDWSFLFLHSDRRAALGLSEDNIESVFLPSNRSAFRRIAWEHFQLRRRMSVSCIDAAIMLGGFVPFRPDLPILSVWQNANIWTSTKEIPSRTLRAYVAIQRMLMRDSLRRSTLNIFLSHNSADRCFESLPFDRQRSEVIPLGIDDRFWEQGEIPDRSTRAPIIAVVGDLYSHKRVEIILQAFSAISPSHPALRCIIAGRAADLQYFEMLRLRSRELGLSDRVDFIGAIEFDQLKNLYRRSLAFVTTSRLETFGLTPLEAMACGLPVVAARASALPETVGDAAHLIESGSPHELTEALTRLIDDESEWQRRSRAGLSRSKHFSWRRVAMEYARQIEHLCSRR